MFFLILLMFSLFSQSYCYEVPENFGVDFYQSMLHTKEFELEKGKKDIHISISKQLYDFYIENLDKEYCENPRISKTIHQIWLGPRPIPVKEREFQQTWIKYHPDWEYKLWRDKDVVKFGLKNQKAYNAAISYGEKADILRYEILYREGGLYVDTDFECLRPFDIFHHTCDFYAGLGFHSYFVVNNSFLASAPGHPAIKAFVDNIIPRPSSDKDKTTVLNRTGPFYISRCLKPILENNSKGIVLFPVTYHYPLPYWERFIPYNQRAKWYCPETFGVHHWHVSWLAK